MSAFDDLMAFQRQTEALAQVAGRLGWDQETVMPEGSAGQRAEEIGALESVYAKVASRVKRFSRRRRRANEAGAVAHAA